MISRIEIKPFESATSEGKFTISRQLVDSLSQFACCIATSPDLPADDNLRMINILSRLFERPAAEKLKYVSAEPLTPGYGPYGRSKALDTGLKNTLETWDINLTTPLNFPDEMLEDWKFIVDYQDRLHNLTVDFLTYLSFGFELQTTTISDLISRENGGIHFIHYLPFDETFNKESRRQSKHYDMSLITIIPASNQPGLEIEANGNWIPVNLKPDEYLIQSGLLLQRLFGDRLKASLHTVECYDNIKDNHRYAFPYFVSPAGDVELSVIEKFNSAETKDKYPIDLVRNIQSDYFSKIFKPDH